MAKNEFFRFGLKGFLGVIVLLLITAQFVLAVEKSDGCPDGFKLVGDSLCISMHMDISNRYLAKKICEDNKSKVCTEKDWKKICDGIADKTIEGWTVHNLSWVLDGVDSYSGIGRIGGGTCADKVTDGSPDSVFCCKELEKNKLIPAAGAPKTKAWSD